MEEEFFLYVGSTVQKCKWWERRSSWELLDVAQSFLLCYSTFNSIAQYSIAANVYFNLSVNEGALLVRDAGPV